MLYNRETVSGMKIIGTTTNGNKLVELTKEEREDLADSSFNSYIEWKHEKVESELDKEIHMQISARYYELYTVLDK